MEEMAEQYIKNMIILNKFFLYKIDKEKTVSSSNLNNLNDKQVFYHDPVEILAIVDIEKTSNTSYTEKNKARYEEYGNITLNVLEKTLKDLNVFIEYGDYVAIEYNSSFIFYSVINNDKKNISLDKSFAGMAPFFKSIECTPIDQNEITMQI